MSPVQMITAYENIAAITGRMKSAAQGAEWDRLSALERDCSALVASLRLDHTAVELTQQQQSRKRELIRQVLADDAEIRRHTEPWMEQLKSFIDSAGKTRRVNRAYGVRPAGHGAADDFGAG